VSGNSAQRLRCERFEQKPKEVVLAPNYRDQTRSVARNPRLVEDLEEITECIENGIALQQRFYRSGIEVDRDELLEEDGVKHLHLDNQGSDVLLFAVEYAERVVFLEVNSHRHFKTEPKGSVLLTLHQQCLKNEDAVAAARAADANGLSGAGK
jgi:hypothetical protein